MFKNFNLDKKNDKIIIGTVKSLSEKYGMEYLIRAISELESLVNKELFKKIEVRIYGDGALRESLISLTTYLNISEKVQFLGYIPNTDVATVINQMEIFVVPSIFNSESFGVAAIEAMACEVPVIVSDADGLKEVVVEGETGFIVPKKNYKEIAKKIKLLIDDEGLRKKLGKNGRKRVEKLYNWDKNVENMLEIYKEVIK
ncbi:glycosyltransferase family 4 protein [Fusobacterium necrophorum]|uniref:Glycosyl transferase family 1 domain-containing protein n=1 Tax=Fusobacterium necrophorum DJ-2 TaxID=1441737 RepID=A0AB73C2B3_9FUSO|nr:glycosyltransferase family 4 protein [Fusobacterium necrophorum]KDE71865.1 hypothetical protein FUSO8_07170 [Fusobacterium necrophorum DJ-2]